jgi:geranylgeranyl transferase type-2 subunit beta
MAVDRKDVKLPAAAPTELLTASHADFIAKYGSDPDDYEYAMSEFLRMNGIYWGVTAMDLMGRLGAMDRPGIVQFLRDCQTPAGGFRPVPGQDPHLLNTLSAVQVSQLSAVKFSHVLFM